MMVSDNDLELIEASLDGDQEAVDALGSRIESEPALADALADAAAAREGRREFWQSLTPTDIKAEQFAWMIRGETAALTPVRRPAAWWMPGGIVRYGSVAAACVVFGFFAGRSATPSPSAQPNPVAAPAQSVLLPISDEYGRQVFQQFKSVEDAKKFEAGLHQTLQSSGPAGGKVVPVSDTEVNF